MASHARDFRYDSWANRRLLARLRELPPGDDEPRKLFAHIVAALKVWELRIRGQDSSGVPIWPAWSLDECEVVLDECESGYAQLTSGLDDESAAEVVSYTNQHDLSYTTAVGDILAHVLLHGGYHRGQVARRLREQGLEPVNTDYITYVRERAGARWKP